MMGLMRAGPMPAPMPEVHDAGDLIVREGAGEPYDWAAAREHWAYRPVGELEAPAVSDPDWCRNEIDRFVLSGLDAAGLEPAPQGEMFGAEGADGVESAGAPGAGPAGA